MHLIHLSLLCYSSREQHYAYLAKVHASSPPAWVIFSDDDDIWDERRAAIYACECAAAPSSTETLLCQWKAMLRHRARDTEPPDAAAVSIE